MSDHLPPTWSQLLDTERHLRAEIHDNEDCRTGEYLRRWYSVASHIMSVCASSCRTGSLALSPPAELFAVLAAMTDSFARGIVPLSVSDVKARGRPQASRLEESDIGWATVYLMAVRIGMIADSSPNKTICETYGVERQTAQAWAKLRPPASLLPIEDLSPRFIRDQMQEAGERYALAGRSSVAIDKRGRQSKAAI